MFKKMKLPALLFLLLLAQSIQAQKVSVSGTVQSTKGETLAGVTVTVKNGDLATVTNEKGSFSISVPVKSILVFSYTGFQTKEIPVDEGSGVLSVSLTQGENVLDEV
ncbi:MAG TPA: carboxypeptidase-like regulatory domain-containing protein, partial [Chryseolinea sp.]|nr:carboxypeptidase-like regulatory domain-containing protein [Chryseolinea sp.]